MSRGLAVYSVSLEALREAMSGGPSADGVRASLGGALSPRVDQLLRGERSVDVAEGVWALEEVCLALGERLPAAMAASLEVRSFATVDDALESAGIVRGFRLTALAFRGAPVPNVDSPPDFPSIGYVEPDIVAEATAQFERNAPSSNDDEVDGVLAEIQDWLLLHQRHQAKSERPLGLVGVYG